MRPDRGPVKLMPSDDQNVFRRFVEGFYATRRSFSMRRFHGWEPPTDVYESPRHIVIKVCIPGIEADQVGVQINGEVVTICGIRKGPDPESVVAYHQMEIRNGYFERRIVIRRPFDPHGATANYTNGFLYVHMPKAPELVHHVMTLRISV